MALVSSKYFTPDQMSKAAPYPEEWGVRLVRLFATADVIREDLGRPMIVTPRGGYRPYDLNKAIGGSRNSQHVHGRAMDFVVPGMPADEVHARILELHRRGLLPDLGGLGNYPSFTHIDTRPGTGRLARWSGSRKDS